MKLGKLIVGAVGVTAGLYLIDKLINDHSDDSGRVNDSDCIDFSTFTNNHVFFDTLDGAKVTQWFREESVGMSRPVLLLLKPTYENAKKFHITGFPDETDTETNLLQLIVDEEDDVFKGRQISFCNMTQKLKEVLAGQEYVVFSQEA